MIKRITISTLLFVYCIRCFAGENADLNRLTTECIKAAKEHKTIKEDFLYKVLHTVSYKGWSGDSNSPELIHPVMLTIRYAGALKEGYYWFPNNPQKKYKFTAKSDIGGNFELFAENADGFKNHKFRGLMKDGIIKGLWGIRAGRKPYAFYVKAIEEEPLNK